MMRLLVLLAAAAPVAFSDDDVPAQKNDNAALDVEQEIGRQTELLSADSVGNAGFSDEC